MTSPSSGPAAMGSAKHPELGEALTRLLEAIYQQRDTNQQSLAVELHLDHTTLAKWAKGETCPNVKDMHKLLSYSLNHGIQSAADTAQAFRLWLTAAGFTTSEVVDLVTGTSADLRVRQLEALKFLLEKQLAWSHHLRELDQLPQPFIQAYNEWAASAVRDPARHPRLINTAKWILENQIMDRVCNFYCAIYDNADWVTRAAIFTPTIQNADFLAIQWQRRLSADSLRYNHWYGGPDPLPDGAHRGIVGEVFAQARGECVPNLLDSGRFVDLHRPPRSREAIPYRHVVQVPLIGRVSGSKFGVLAFDSMHHEFKKDDLDIIGEAANLVSHVLEASGVPYKSTYEPPFDPEAYDTI